MCVCVFPGIFFSFGAVGPAIGYLLAGWFLTFYGDLNYVDTDTYVYMLYLFHLNMHLSHSL